VTNLINMRIIFFHLPITAYLLIVLAFTTELGKLFYVLMTLQKMFPEVEIIVSMVLDKTIR